VCIDLSFDKMMNSRNIESLAKQLSYCYSKNKESEKMLRLNFTSFGEEFQNIMDIKQNSWRNWKLLWSKESFLSLYDKNNIIYLTPDSENTIETLVEGKCYIIGGLIDRNKHKNFTLEFAKESGIQTSKFPLNDFFKLKSSVLTVDQSFSILSNFYNSNNWEDAIISSIPKRKIDQENDENSNEEN
jgi:tRNA (guanine9-N1)-methyltransferase